LKKLELEEKLNDKQRDINHVLMKTKDNDENKRFIIDLIETEFL
jgi:hypothetical protein